MSTTQNYGLYIEDDDSTLFQTWRQKMNGTDDSNMVKIDQALSEKGDKSTCVYGTLSAASWAGTAAPYTQSVQVTGLSASQNGEIALSPSATAAQKKAAQKAALSVAAQAANSLTISAELAKPDVDIPFVIILIN